MWENEFAAWKIKPVVLQNELAWASNKDVTNKTSLSVINLSFFSFRTAVKAVVERLTQSAFYTSARALFERDRPLFSLLCALEVSKCWSCSFDSLLRHCGPTTDLLQYSTPCNSLNKSQLRTLLLIIIASWQIVDSLPSLHSTIVWFESNCTCLETPNSSTIFGFVKWRHHN